jgi:hypothetical protein
MRRSHSAVLSIDGVSAASEMHLGCHSGHQGCRQGCGAARCRAWKLPLLILSMSWHGWLPQTALVFLVPRNPGNLVRELRSWSSRSVCVIIKNNLQQRSIFLSKSGLKCNLLLQMERGYCSNLPAFCKCIFRGA